MVSILWYLLSIQPIALHQYCFLIPYTVWKDIEVVGTCSSYIISKSSKNFSINSLNQDMQILFKKVHYYVRLSTFHYFSYHAF